MTRESCAEHIREPCARVDPAESVSSVGRKASPVFRKILKQEVYYSVLGISSNQIFSGFFTNAPSPEREPCRPRLTQTGTGEK